MENSLQVPRSLRGYLANGGLVWGAKLAAANIEQKLIPGGVGTTKTLVASTKREFAYEIS